jgi:hypothetical protein
MGIRKCKTQQRGVEMRKDNEEMNKTRIEAERTPREAENFGQNAHLHAGQKMQNSEMTIGNEKRQRRNE